ncbi:putative exonuclease v [Phaeomoniella chlamydospora]|uniref:Putative exonuclease v n=1 Tax=Phaeomoniella chlamydospora TaxID=158046 RepID=A0A0G2E5X9_PHACM|nr:putative exonuclease v [Phaeomoniella chlamydospora]
MTLQPFNPPSSEPITDYGSDWDDEFVDEIVSTSTKLTAGSEEPLVITDIEDYETPTAVRLPKVHGKEAYSPRWRDFASTRSPATIQSQELHRRIAVEVSEKVPIANAHENGDEDARESTATTSVDVKEIDDIELDTRSPLERFRVPPKKALSVTDLISPAWCELQYFYTLSKHGKKKRTPAMKQGTKIHKQLENEVHTTYPVTVLTREDGWGLRLWNVIQSLRTLEETGRTREMEIWGLVEGEFVNGVVDELGYQNPDPKGENAAAKLLPEDQKTITEYLTKHAGGHDITTAMNQDIADPKKSPIAAHSSAISCEKVIYLTDIKTRASRSIPDTASTLPTQFQLFLYHHFIEQLALGRFPLQAVADRYELDVDATFSDEFIAQSNVNGFALEPQFAFLSMGTVDVLCPTCLRTTFE